MTIAAYANSYQEIIGYTNASYSSLTTVNGAKRYGAYSSIQGDIGSHNNPSNPFVVVWAVVFAFSILPADKSQKFGAISTANYGVVTVVREGQQTDAFYLNYECSKSPTYTYTYQNGSATYPRGRYNPTVIGNVQNAWSLTGISLGLSARSGDEMYIKSEYADAGAITLDLQVQYFASITYSVSGSNYHVDI